MARRRMQPMDVASLFLLLLVSTASASFDCPPTCSCVSESYQVNCSNTDIAWVQTLPNSTRALYFDNAHLRKVPCEKLRLLLNLKVLSLAQNRIQDIDENCHFLFRLHLDLLDLSGNSFRAIPYSRSIGTRAKTVNLAGNLINELWPLQTYSYQDVRELILDNNQIETIPSMLLSEKSKLKLLSIKNNRISKMGNESTFSGSLTSLILEGNAIVRNKSMWLLAADNLENLSLRGAYAVDYTFSSNNGWELPGFSEKLRSLDLSNNALFSLEEQCFSRCKNLRFLNLRNTSISKFREGESQNLNFLETLLLSYNSITILEANVFFYIKNLEYLDLSFNKIEFISEETFTQGLTKLHFLNLSNNLLTDVRFLQRASLISLEILDLSGNLLVDVNMDLHGKFPNLEVILLSNNTLQVIPDVSGMTNLVELDLANNKITYVDYSVFKDATNLSDVMLDGNIVTKFDPFPAETNIGPSLFLRDNPLRCDCDESWFRNASIAFNGNTSLYLLDNIKDAQCISKKSNENITLSFALKTISCSGGVGQIVLLVILALVILFVACVCFVTIMRTSKSSSGKSRYESQRSQQSHSAHDVSETKYTKGELSEVKMYKEAPNGKYDHQMVLRAERDQHLKDALSLSNLKGSMVRLDKANVKPFFEEIYV